MFTTDQNALEQQQYYQPTSNDSGEQIRTLFLTGLPEDVREREVHNLFRFVPGYEGCKMTLMNQRPVSFASFQSREFALSAIQQVNGIQFDPEFEVNLKVEFARSNSKVKTMNDGSQQQEKRRKMGSSHSQQQQNYGGYNYSGAQYHDNYSTYGYNEPYSHSSMHSMNGPPLSSHNPQHNQHNLHNPHNQHNQHTQINHSRVLTPCTTLYVTGLDPSVNQSDLISIFSSGTGFQRFLLGKDAQHCFLDYMDLNSSANALTSLNGYQVGNNRIKVVYAKKKMGEARNLNNNNNREGNHVESHFNEQQ
jgi:RNA recognition motif-containing protein